jgi:hypothetical protein
LTDKEEVETLFADMANTKKRRKAKKKLPIEEAIEKIVAMMEESAKALPEPERAAMLGRIHAIAAETIAERRGDAAKRKKSAADGASSAIPVRRNTRKKS